MSAADLDCCWCPARRFRSRQALADHEHEHRLADIAMREREALRDSRAIAERLAEAAAMGMESE